MPGKHVPGEQPLPGAGPQTPATAHVTTTRPPHRRLCAGERLVLFIFIAGLVLYVLITDNLVPTAGTGAVPEVVCGMFAGSGSVILLARWALRRR